MSKNHIHPLRIIREQHNLTIEKLAEAAKLGAQIIWNAEHNRPIGADHPKHQIVSKELQSICSNIIDFDIEEHI